MLLVSVCLKFSSSGESWLCAAASITQGSAHDSCHEAARQDQVLQSNGMQCITCNVLLCCSHLTSKVRLLVIAK